RSVHDGQLFDRVPEVAARYLRDRRQCRPLKSWATNYPAQTVKAGETLRVQAPAPFRLRWSPDNWRTMHDTESAPTAIGIAFVDLPVHAGARDPLRFTFFWTQEGRWEG